MIGLPPVILVASAPDRALDKYAGAYDGGQTEIAAGLELAKDGRFRYGLSYGAVDEAAAGHWTIAGDRIVLTVEQFESSDPSAESFGPSVLTIDDGVLMLPRFDRVLRFHKQ